MPAVRKPNWQGNRHGHEPTDIVVLHEQGVVLHEQGPAMPFAFVDLHAVQQRAVALPRYRLNVHRINNLLRVVVRDHQPEGVP